MTELNPEVVIREELETLANMRKYREDWLAELQLRIDGLIPEVIRQQIKELEIEYDTKDIDKSIEAQEMTIKNYVLLHGNSVKSDRLTAVYIKPGYTANIDKLLGMAVTLPQLMTCLKSKNPYVQIKTNKKESEE